MTDPEQTTDSGQTSGAEQLLDKAFGLADLPVLRAALRDCAIAAGLGDQRREEFVLAAHELLANAIVHGGGSGQLRVSRADDELRCQVRDRGPGLTAVNRDGAGLRIVRALVDRLDVNGNRTGADVTMIMRAPPTSPSR
jgi:anti-sigma regulatory factor (Ser/Thr protein kinase)